MKDFGSKYQVTRMLPDRATVFAVVVFALLIFAGEAFFLLGIDKVAESEAQYRGETSPYWANEIIIAEVEK